jgi:hypothetical protein
MVVAKESGVRVLGGCLVVFPLIESSPVHAPLSACHCESPHRESADCPTLIRSSEGRAGPGAGTSQDPALAPDRDDFLGQKFGSFEVVRELGRGGMGTV